MTRRKVDFSDYANLINKSLPFGILLTTKANDRVNSMVIGWGTVGINWSRPMFVAYVREGRCTRGQLDTNPEFTVNVPTSDTIDKNIIAVCGGKSGRNTDKIAEAGLTLVEPEIISVPAIREFPLTLECRVIYRQKQELDLLCIDPALKARLYPQSVDGTAVMANRDPHISYYGEIVSAYILD